MAVASKVSGVLLAKWKSLNDRRKALERQARDIGKEESAIADDVKGALEAAGKTTLSRGGFRVTIIKGRPSVGWKGEYIKALGAVNAHKLEQAAPVPTRVEVTEEPASPAKRRAA